VNRDVSATEFFLQGPGALPQANMGIAPLALNRYWPHIREQEAVMIGEK
jgi:hypothetical protein